VVICRILNRLSAKYRVFWIYTLLVINYDVSEGVNAGKCVELKLWDNFSRYERVSNWQ